MPPEDERAADREKAKALFEQAKQAFMQNDWERARSAAGEAVEIAPESAASQFLLGASMGQLGRLEEAVEPLRRSVELDPENPNGFNTLGMTLGQLGQQEEADQALARAAFLGHPQARETLANMGLGYCPECGALLKSPAEECSCCVSGARIPPSESDTSPPSAPTDIPPSDESKESAKVNLEEPKAGAAPLSPAMSRLLDDVRALERKVLQREGRTANLGCALLIAAAFIGAALAFRVGVGEGVVVGLVVLGLPAIVGFPLYRQIVRRDVSEVASRHGVAYEDVEELLWACRGDRVHTNAYTVHAKGGDREAQLKAAMSGVPGEAIVKSPGRFVRGLFEAMEPGADPEAALKKAREVKTILLPLLKQSELGGQILEAEKALEARVKIRSVLDRIEVGRED
jgi:hypothetical protein